MRVAGIDCGTNSIRLLIADGAPGSKDDPGSNLSEVVRGLEIVRLGQGVDATGAFHPDALARTFAAVDTYAALITDHQCDAVRFVATSAARDATNSTDFFSGIQARLGVPAEVISGAEEAQLSFRGAIHGLPPDQVSDPVLVMDIGGGSTELVLGGADGIRQSASIDIGSVRLTERFARHDPPTVDELTAAGRLVDELLDNCGVDLTDVATWIGVAGTATSLSAINQGLQAYDRKLVHGSRLTRARLAELTSEISGRTSSDRVEAYALHPGRADVIPFGALIADRVADRVGADLLISETDILDGIVLGLLETLEG
ncbi:MAG: Ppx/GppA family phosphatase [Propionibacteriales bacterium]|nr:Ppx/GppA family phosphatase [Propionibacteriales bacterium]